jgi:hypothetical protein
MKKKLFFTFLVPILFSFHFLFAQDNVEVIVTGDELAQYQSVFISDIDFLQAGTSEKLFNLQIIKNSESAVPNCWFRLDFFINNERLAYSETDLFTLPAGVGMWVTDNVQLSNEMFDFNGMGETITIDESGIDDDADDLRNDILAQGQLPVGQYQLNVILYENDPGKTGGQQLDDDVTNFVISNPTLINLVTPGVLVNSGFSYEIFTQQPIFQFNGNSGDYQVVVFKKRDDFASIDDILNSIPVWESPRLNELSVQYPDGGVIPLDFGSTYVWMVRAFIQTSSGENFINSELWEFTLVDPSQTNITQASMAKQELELLLRQLLGNNADQIIKEIDDYDLTSIRVNGATLTVQELYQVIEKYRDQPHDIYDLILRSSN